MKNSFLTRQHQILQAVIEDYVSLREPVSSKALVERHQLGVSSATVRHEMATLEEMGLIQALHSSSGRVPTAKGYRFFVDKIASPRPLKPAEKNAIHRLLDTSDTLAEVYEQTVRLLSQLTHQVAILQLPKNTGESIRHIEILNFSSQSLLAILIDNAGQVYQKIILIPAFTESVEQLQQDIADLLKGQSFSQACLKIQHSLASISSSSSLSIILHAIDDLLVSKQSSKLLISGTSYLAESTEDFSRSIAPILEALEEQVIMLQLLNAMTENDHVTVRIGSENQAQKLSEASIVASPYGASSSHNLAVLGPTRMDYSSSMATVHGVANYLSKILGT